uniref:Uncharacterized protein n=1 Tax=Anguilla anguilla TaxID=7936 RepID=A0A0E9TH90_ANGAN
MYHTLKGQMQLWDGLQLPKEQDTLLA